VSANPTRPSPLQVYIYIYIYIYIHWGLCPQTPGERERERREGEERGRRKGEVTEGREEKG